MPAGDIENRAKDTKDLLKLYREQGIITASCP